MLCDRQFSFGETYLSLARQLAPTGSRFHVKIGLSTSWGSSKSCQRDVDAPGTSDRIVFPEAKPASTCKVKNHLLRRVSSTAHVRISAPSVIVTVVQSGARELSYTTGVVPPSNRTLSWTHFRTFSNRRGRCVGATTEELDNTQRVGLIVTVDGTLTTRRTVKVIQFHLMGKCHAQEQSVAYGGR